jgi:methylphosphotriester-DNA--protein-cysteine methyltransferase
MKFLVRPELPTAALRSSQATLAAVDNSAPVATRPQSTYKSGKAVQTSGATSFFNRFQAHLGQTPGEYLQWWRLQLAAQKLKETRESISEIAMAVGYESASAFARAFKRAMGHSPNNFRFDSE